jgi:hypothetical protein
VRNYDDCCKKNTIDFIINYCVNAFLLDSYISALGNCMSRLPPILSLCSAQKNISRKSLG